MVSVQNRKSLYWAYVFWLFGGIFGAHLFYLQRGRHAFVYLTTMGGLGIAWIFDCFRINEYVKDANGDYLHMNKVIDRMRLNKKPPFSTERFILMILVSYSWSQLMILAIPTDEIWGMNLRYLNILVPLVVSIAVWTVGNIGREQGTIKWPLLAAYSMYPIRYFVYDETLWLSLMIMAASIAFDNYSKEWRRNYKHHHIVKRVAVFGVCICLYLSLWCSYLYFNGTVTDNEGDEIPLHEALHTFFTTNWWLDLKQGVSDLYQYIEHHGWYEVWKLITEFTDQQEDEHALKVLGVNIDASEQTITAKWRQLSRENHPDKFREPALRRSAELRFMQIQQAYEKLSTSKHRRIRKNKKDNS